jgi:hypothetical protein
MVTLTEVELLVHPFVVVEALYETEIPALVVFINVSAMVEAVPFTVLGVIPDNDALDQEKEAPLAPRLLDNTTETALPEQTSIGLATALTTGLGFTVNVTTSDVSHGPVTLLTLQR